MLVVNDSMNDTINSLTNLLNTTAKSYDLEIESAKDKLKQAEIALEIAKTT
jgi:hypothetical protein